MFGITTNGANISRQAFSLGQTDVLGNPRYFMRIEETDGTGGPAGYTKIEGVHNFAGEDAVITLYAKADSAITVPVNVRQNFGSGGSPSAQITTSAGNLSLTTSWQKFALPVTLPSISGKSLGSNMDDYVQVDFSWSGLGTPTIDLASLRMDPGSEAPSGEMRPVWLERLLFARYYTKTFVESIAPAHGTNSSAGCIVQYVTTAMSPGYLWTYPVQMARIPTIAIYNYRAGGAAGQWSNGAVDLGNSRAVNISETGAEIDNAGTAPLSNGYWYIHAVADARF